MGAQQTLLLADSAQAFAEHLRTNPADAFRKPEELADDFGLPREFVEEVLSSVRGGSIKDRSRERFWSSSVGSAFHRLRGLLLALTARPMLFVGTTTLAATLYLCMISPGLYVTKAGSTQASISVTLAGSVVFALLAMVQLFCYYSHGMARLALLGSLASWLVSTPVVMIYEWTMPGGSNSEYAIPMLLASALTLLMVSFLFGGLGIIASVVGGYVRVIRMDRAELNMSRQQLLERLFEIQTSVRRGEEFAGPSNRWNHWIHALRRHTFLWASGLGLTTHALQVVGLTLLVNLVKSHPTLIPVLVVGGMVVTVVQFLSMIAIGYFAGTVGKGVLAVCWFMVWAFVAELIPFGANGPGTLQEILTPSVLATQFGIAALVGGAAGLGAIVQERAARQMRLRSNDRSALFAEMVRIQWRLGPSVAELCVLVVDAAQSAAMKDGADHLDVEYSFREYLSLIEAVCRRYGGRVHNTMGDGAIVTFSNCPSAFQAAKDLQGEMESFNMRVNRLAQPFRLRMGLHKGLVAGDIDKVEFSQVIDIAAHVQGAPPIGGIAVTEEVARELDDEPLAELKERVDGCRVFLALNPR